MEMTPNMTMTSKIKTTSEEEENLLAKKNEADNYRPAPHPSRGPAWGESTRNTGLLLLNSQNVVSALVLIQTSNIKYKVESL